jgi:hypothetical protein
MKRVDLLNLLEATLTHKQPDYARQVAQRYLVDWPGDLGVQLVLARAYAAEGYVPQAVKILEGIVAADPEDFRAQRLLGEQLTALGTPAAAALAFTCAHIGDGLGMVPAADQPDSGTSAQPAWVAAARAAYLAEHVGDWKTAQREAQSLIGVATTSPLPSLIQLSALWHAGQLSLAYPLAQAFYARWPRVIAFKLCLAECLLASGDNAQALERLHDAAAQDITGQVVARHWGEAHPYRRLWNDDPNVTVTFPGPLPAPLMEALGLNRLTGKVEPAPIKSEAHGPKTAGLPSQPEEIANIQEQLSRVAGRLAARQNARPNKAKASQPKYILLSSRTRLVQAFGMDGFVSIDTMLKTLAVTSATRRLPVAARMPAHVIYVDDPETLKPFGLRPINPANAWDVKTLIGKLAEQLAKQDSAIGALLIVGGPDIIPFHHLPNPTDDGDADIPSDNPYATADENYFVPEWPVGRLPSGAGRNPEPLLRLLRQAAGNYTKRKSLGHVQHWLTMLLELFMGRRSSTTAAPQSTLPSFGYSANIWKASSAEVYTAIGDPLALVTCPPWDANALPSEGLVPANLSYFNLHGIEDGPEWYGQRGPADPSTLPEYPVALRPTDVVNSGRAPAVVFSEACYGTNIIGKGTNDALSLRFMDCGTHAIVGSTKIAYGSVTPPLIGADLLGRYFWQNVNAGWPVGEALRQAKLQMAQEMHNRQGFLDGEDQKTLISFILFGDPLSTAPDTRPAKNAKQRKAPALRVMPKTICDKAVDAYGVSDGTSPLKELTPETVSHIKSVVAQYLPGMNDAQWRVAHTRADCSSKNHLCPTGQLSALAKSPGGASLPNPTPRRTVVTLSKTIRSSTHTHPHFARVTLDENGKVVKLAVSR